MGLFKGGKNIFKQVVRVGTNLVGQLANVTDKALGGQGSVHQKISSITDPRLLPGKFGNVLTAAGSATILGLAAAGTAGAASKGLVPVIKTGLGSIAALGLASSTKVSDAAFDLPKTTAAAASKVAEFIDEGVDIDLTGKTALGIGAVVLGAAGALAIPKIIGSFKKDKDGAVILPTAPSVATPQSAPVVKETPKAMEPVATPTSISVKVSNKPTINVAIAS